MLRKKLDRAFQNQARAFLSPKLIYCATKFRPGPPSLSLFHHLAGLSFGLMIKKSHDRGSSAQFSEKLMVG